ncbi:TsoY family (seleno)protein [Halocynthiibacter sp.]|uniref:TsoY family (seleno)protein n=1 Tax=Halocynthiibacter sp. TaxID=1979210 RepID=UPI003C5DD04C
MSAHTQSVASRSWSPLYFLAALGAGGLSVTFFMYLMFWVPHTGRPVPVFEDLMSHFASSGAAGKLIVTVGMTGIAAMTVLHVALMVFNLRQLSAFKASAAYKNLMGTNAETQLLAAPLAAAMTINAGFIAGLVFVPGLWGIVEYLFPLALIAFVLVGIWSFQLLGAFLVRVFSEGGFNHKANNSFAQVLASFTLSMVAVGMAAPAAMSKTPWVVAASLSLSSFMMMTTVIVAAVALVLAVRSILEHGIAEEAAPTLMVIVPLLTVIGIALLRIDHGLHTTFDVHAASGATFLMLTRILAVQILFLMLGMAVLKRINYSAKFMTPESKRSAGSYALVCPGVALSVMLHFWVNKGLVANGVIEKFSTVYWIANTPALIAQFAMIVLVLKLHRLHFAKGSMSGAAMPAE